MAKVRYKEKPELVGAASRFNMSSVNEVVVCWRDGDMSTEFPSSLEVEIGNAWKPLTEAFRDHDLVSDSLNTCFFEPRTGEDRERGYTL